VLHLLQRTITRAIVTIIVMIGVAWAAGFLLILAVSVWAVLRT
jgi:hypothetical protein